MWKVAYKSIWAFVAVVLAAILISNIAHAAAGRHAPLGYQLMCLNNPGECRGGGAPRVAASNEIMATLKRVNSQINRSIRPKADGQVDVWSANGNVGDCEDYVLAKRRLLIRAGIPPSSLRIAFVKTKSGISHAILVVITERGKLVLDNLTATIRPLGQTGYRVVSMQSADPQSWS